MKRYFVHIVLFSAPILFAIIFNLKIISVYDEIYKLKMDLKKIHSQTLLELENKSREHIEILSLVEKDVIDGICNKNQERIEILESAISPENFRWAKILQVRRAVQDTYEDFNYPVVMSTQELTNYASAVVDWSEKYDVPVSLILAVSRRESAFNPRAKSKANAQGIMQIIPSTAEEIGNQINQPHFSMYKVSDNIRFGTYYLMTLLDRYERNFETALQAYNCGPTCVSRVSSGQYSSFPQETERYVKFILTDCLKENNNNCELKGFLKYYQDKGL